MTCVCIMEENKFFRTVWRFNGVLISIAGLLALVILLVIAFKVIKDLTDSRSARNIVNVAGNNQIEEEWRFGGISLVEGSTMLMIPLYSDQTFDRSYFSKSLNSTRNYLFVNSNTSAKNWLFSHTDFLIEKTDKLQEGGYDSKKPVIAILYQLIKLDSDQDERLSTDDLITLAITKPDGTAYLELMEDIEIIIDHTIINKDELFLIYRKAGISNAAVIDLNSFEIIENNQIPSI